MTSQQFLVADFLDILFENRNKEYGAYFLRRVYPSHLKKAVGLMLLFVTALFIYGMNMPHKNEIVSSKRGKDTLIINLDPFKPKEPEPPIQRSIPQLPPTRLDRVPVIVDIPDTSKLVPDRADTTSFTSGPTNKSGSNHGTDFIVGSGGGEPHEADSVSKAPEPAEPEIWEVSEVAPEFPGGKDAWLNFLQRMLRVPDDLEAGERKTVLVKFVVNKDGIVSDVVILKSAGIVFDKEVQRVISRMPKWKPGKQNGKPVAVYFTQPVTFMAEEN